MTLITDDTHRPFTVTATLRTGAGWGLPYGLDLAGIVAAHLRRLDQERRIEEGRYLSDPPSDTTDDAAYDLPLPLARCGSGNQWHWAATCAIPVDPGPNPEPRMYYGVMDLSWSHRAAERPLPFISAKAGPYKDVMMAGPIVLCPAIMWRGIGDIAAVQDAVRPIRFLGKRRTNGEGEVLEWSVTEENPEDPMSWVHHEGGTILRPCPMECAESLGLRYRVGSYALRPPSWHPDRLEELAMTDDSDEEAWFD